MIPSLTFLWYFLFFIFCVIHYIFRKINEVVVSDGFSKESSKISKIKIFIKKILVEFYWPFFIVVFIVFVGYLSIWYSDKKWEKEKNQIESVYFYDLQDTYKKTATFSFEKRYRVKMENPVYGFDFLLKYPSGEPASYSDSDTYIHIYVNASTIENLKNYDLYHKLSDEEKKSLSSLDKGKTITLLKVVGGNRFDEVIEAFLDKNKEPVFLINFTESRYEVVRSLFGKIQIRYLYDKNDKTMPASFVEVDQFVMSFLEQRMINHTKN